MLLATVPPSAPLSTGCARQFPLQLNRPSTIRRFRSLHDWDSLSGGRVLPLASVALYPFASSLLAGCHLLERKPHSLAARQGSAGSSVSPSMVDGPL